jgi:hypothetical protein
VGENASDVRRDIEHIRGDLDRDLDQLGDRVSPRRIYERRTQGVRDRMHSVKDAVMGSAERVASGAADGTHRAGDAASGITGRAGELPDMVATGTRGNPLAAGFIAFGIGLLLGSVPPPTDAERQVAGQVGEQLEPIKQKAAESAQRVGEEMKGATGDAARTLQEDARSAAEHVREQAQESAQEVRREASGSGSDTGSTR